MKSIWRAEHAGEEYSKVVNGNKRMPVPDNEDQVSRPKPMLDRSSALRLKVFVVDDSTEVKNRLKEMLEENKSIQLVAESGDADQALAALHQLRPDVIILDIHMPGGGGMRVLKDSKTRYPGTIVIIFTVFSYPQYRQAYLSAGADFFLDKADGLQKLADVLAELARTHGMNENNEKRGKDK